jgi:pyocin large subunit-like protein
METHATHAGKMRASGSKNPTLNNMTRPAAIPRRTNHLGNAPVRRPIVDDTSMNAPAIFTANPKKRVFASAAPNRSAIEPAGRESKRLAATAALAAAPAANSIATNSRPLARKTVAKSWSSSRPMRRRSAARSHVNAIPENGMR